MSVAKLSDMVEAGDNVILWNDETHFYDDKTSYHYPALPEWAGTIWDWGDGTTITVGGPTATHVYQKPGTYSITIKCNDIEGAVAIAIKKIRALALLDMASHLLQV